MFHYVINFEAPLNNRCPGQGYPLAAPSRSGTGGGIGIGPGLVFSSTSSRSLQKNPKRLFYISACTYVVLPVPYRVPSDQRHSHHSRPEDHHGEVFGVVHFVHRADRMTANRVSVLHCREDTESHNTQHTECSGEPSFSFFPR